MKSVSISYGSSDTIENFAIATCKILSHMYTHTHTPILFSNTHTHKLKHTHYKTLAHYFRFRLAGKIH